MTDREAGRRTRPPVWTDAEVRIAKTFARRVLGGEFKTLKAATLTCMALLAREKVGPPRTFKSVDYKLAEVAAELGRHPSRSYWTPREDRVIDRFARAVINDAYPDCASTTKDCRRALARVRGSGRHTPKSIAFRVNNRALELGRPPQLPRWTRDELHALDDYTRGLAAGRFSEVKSAARAFRAEMNRRRRTRPDLQVRSQEAVERKMWVRAHRLRLNWDFRTWSESESRIVDRYVKLVVAGHYRSLRAAGRDCLKALRSADAHKEYRRAGRARPHERSVQAVRQRLVARAQELGPLPVSFRHWSLAERAVVALWTHRRIPGLRPGRGITARSQVEAMRRELAERGFVRTHDACRRVLGRMRRDTSPWLRH